MEVLVIGHGGFGPKIRELILLASMHGMQGIGFAEENGLELYKEEIKSLCEEYELSFEGIVNLQREAEELIGLTSQLSETRHLIAGHSSMEGLLSLVDKLETREFIPDRKEMLYTATPHCGRKGKPERTYNKIPPRRLSAKKR